MADPTESMGDFGAWLARLGELAGGSAEPQTPTQGELQHHAGESARISWELFAAYMEAGFTRAEAMELTLLVLGGQR